MLAKTILVSLFATAALAAPASSPRPKGMPTPVALNAETDLGKWTIEGLNRTCDKKDTECTWRFSIDTHKEGGTPYDCVYNVTGSDDTPASKSSGPGADCEVFTIKTGYDKTGFTMLTPVHPPTERMIYAGYADEDLKNATTLPDLSWKVEYVPGHQG